MEEVKNFYSKIKFPGLYSIEHLEFYDEILINSYLKEFDIATMDCDSIIDLGCGTGFIINFLARRYPNKKFTAIDFSNSIDYAEEFALKNNLKNIKFIKEDILNFDSNQKYDLVISNGVLHHIPKYKEALQKIKNLSNYKIIIGLYNTNGKLFKKIFPVNYRSEVLFLDQEQCPFEITFNDSEVKELFSEFTLLRIYPSLENKLVDFINFFNYKNGGLTVYSWQRN